MRWRTTLNLLPDNGHPCQNMENGWFSVTKFVCRRVRRVTISRHERRGVHLAWAMARRRRAHSKTFRPAIPILRTQSCHTCTYSSTAISTSCQTQTARVRLHLLLLRQVRPSFRHIDAYLHPPQHATLAPFRQAGTSTLNSTKTSSCHHIKPHTSLTSALSSPPALLADRTPPPIGAPHPPPPSRPANQTSTLARRRELSRL